MNIRLRKQGDFAVVEVQHPGEEEWYVIIRELTSNNYYHTWYQPEKEKLAHAMSPVSVLHEQWRVGSKVPINIYEGDRPVCQCHNVFDSKRIVDAMNKW